VDRVGAVEGLPYGYSLGRPDDEIDTAELETIERVSGRAMRCDIFVDHYT
jgi:hypothetical protein